MAWPMTAGTNTNSTRSKRSPVVSKRTTAPKDHCRLRGMVRIPKRLSDTAKMRAVALSPPALPARTTPETRVGAIQQITMKPIWLSERQLSKWTAA